MLQKGTCSCSIFLNLVFIMVYAMERLVIDSQVYIDYMDSINLSYVLNFTNLLAYMLYCKQVRQPII